MNTHLNPLLAVSLVTIILYATIVAAQDETRRLPTYDEIRSDDWTVRRDSFVLLIGTTHVTYGQSGGLPVIPELRELIDAEPETADARIEGLIELLEIENSVGVDQRRLMFSNDPPYLSPEDRLPTAYYGYYPELIWAVSTLNDLRSMNALIGAITTGGMATGALIAFGIPAVRPIAELLDHDTANVRSSAVRTLSEMLVDSEAVRSDSESVSIIREAIYRAATDQYFTVRMSAVGGLARLGDQESIALIQRIANKDSFRADFQDNRYVVRELARRALEELAE